MSAPEAAPKIPGRVLIAPARPLLARELLDFLLTVPDAARVVLVKSDDEERVRYSARRDTVEIHGEVQE